MMNTLVRPHFIALVALVALSAGVVVASAMTGASAPNANGIDLEADNSQYLSGADSAQTDLDLSNDLTFELWVKFESLQGSDDDIFLAKQQATGNNRSYSFYSGGSGSENLTLSWWHDGLSEGGNVSVSWLPSVDTWYHLAVTKDDTTVKFYVNGTQQGTTQTGSNSAIYNGTADFRIGADQEDAADDFDGKIDDVRIWRIARTAADIAADQSRGLNGNEFGLVAYWQLDGLLSDATQNANTLMNNGAAIFSADTRPLQ